ncbi:MAG: tyrosine-type recombinase/integrase [Bacteroidales bacterium]|nr:tyrosine-type recombinase/integrase [Bacteroidales bacterium]
MMRPHKSTPTGMFSEFHDYLRLEQNRSRLTVEAYCRDLHQFAGWITDNQPGRFDPTSVTAGDIRTWLTRLSKEGDSMRTLRRKTQSLRAFWKFLRKRGYADSDPAADVALAKISKTLPEFARTEEIEKIIATSAASSSPYDRMEHLILVILYTTGIRQAELLGLRDRDISLSAGEAIVTGKRDKQRIVPLAPSLLTEIKEWQQLRDTRWPDIQEPRPLFVNIDGAPLSKSALYRIVSRTLAHTSATHKGAHTLRHSFATAMLNGGATLDTVKEFLGHESLATTQVYTHLSYAQLLEDYRSAHPRGTSGRPERTKKKK